jgi:outer membrane protein
MKQTVVTMLVLLFVTTLYSQENMQFTLDKALAYALEHNYSIANAQLDVKASKKKVWETTAIGLPQANAKVAYQNTFEAPMVGFGTYVDYSDLSPDAAITRAYIDSHTFNAPEIPLGVEENVTTDITVSQLIFNGSYIVGLQASRTYKDLSVIGLEKSKQEVKQAVSNLFYLCLITEERIGNLDKNLKAQTEVKEEVKALMDAGFVEDTDYDQMAILVNNLALSVNTLKQQKEIFYNQLKLLMGIPITEGITLNGDLDSYFEAVDHSENKTDKFSVDNNIDYQLMNTQVRLSHLNLKNKKAEFLPVISAFYNHQRLLEQPDFSFAIPNMIGINLEMPLLSSGMRLSTVGQARIALDKDRNDQWQLEQNLEIEFLQARSDYLSAQEKFENEKENLNLSERIFNKTTIKYKNGMSSSMDLSNAQSQYLNSQTSYYEAIYQLLSSKVKLDKLIGNI